MSFHSPAMTPSCVPILVTRDPRLVELVTASAAALGRSIEVCREPEDLQRNWRDAPLVLVGGDSAEYLASFGLGTREGVHLVGEQLRELALWSVPLGASVICLPEQGGILAELLGRQLDEKPTGRALWVVGASGGLGASTLCCALAAEGARKRKTALIELDQLGGVDLICGAENLGGWRWPDLAGVGGQLDELSGRVPRTLDVDLIAMGRSGGEPSPQAVAAVVGSLRRSHNLILLDGGRQRPVLAELSVLLLVGADVRSVASAQALARNVDLADADLVVRVGPGRSIAPTLIAETLGLPLQGVVPTDRRLPRMLEAGRMPGSLGGRFKRAVARLDRGLNS